jgi:FkbM family methyltransferase
MINKLRKVWAAPRSIPIKICQGIIDSVRGYSYNFEKNGESRLLNNLATLKLNTIFDVGSNIGDYARIARAFFPHAAIHCFELSPRTYRTLAENLKNDLNINLNNFGLSDRATEIEFKDYGPDSPVNTILTDSIYHDHRISHTFSSARLETGSDYCASKGVRQIDLLKVDVEGAEHMVLQGFSDLLANKAVRIVQFEYGYANGDAKFLMRDFFKFFESYGYMVGRLSKQGVVFEPWSYKLNDFRSGPNFVAVRQDDDEIVKTIAPK